MLKSLLKFVLFFVLIVGMCTECNNVLIHKKSSVSHGFRFVGQPSRVVKMRLKIPLGQKTGYRVDNYDYFNVYLSLTMLSQCIYLCLLVYFRAFQNDRSVGDPYEFKNNYCGVALPGEEALLIWSVKLNVE